MLLSVIVECHNSLLEETCSPSLQTLVTQIVHQAKHRLNMLCTARRYCIVYQAQEECNGGCSPSVHNS